MTDAEKLEDLEARQSALERFAPKHFAHLYARVEPAEVLTMLDGMKSIYTHLTSPKGEKPPAPEGRKDLEGMASIYHTMTPKKKQ